MGENIQKRWELEKGGSKKVMGKPISMQNRTARKLEYTAQKDTEVTHEGFVIILPSMCDSVSFTFAHHAMGLSEHKPRKCIIS